MKNTDKVTLTIGQLKKLVKEANDHYDQGFEIPKIEIGQAIEFIISNLIEDAFNEFFDPSHDWFETLEEDLPGNEEKVFDYVKRNLNKKVREYCEKHPEFEYRDIKSKLMTDDAIRDAFDYSLNEMYQDI